MADLLQCMRSFQRVVERGSFSAVARELHLGQSAVSKQVAALEAHLGVRLLLRSTHELSLTEEGAEYYRHCLSVLAALEEAEAAVGRHDRSPSGTLRVSCSIAFGHYLLIPRLAALLDRYPRLQVEVLMSDERHDLVREGIDVAIRFGELEDSELVALPLGLSQRLLTASPAYLERRGVPASPTELAEHECVIFTPVNRRARWRLGGPGGPHEVALQGRLRVDSALGVRAAVLAGLAIGLTPVWLLQEELHSGRVVPVLPAHPPPPIALHAIYPRSRHPSMRR